VTEDGTRGRKGLATDVLKNILRNTQYAIRNTLYACGPTRMLKGIAAIAKAHRIPCQVSLEERMACGVGVCLGCPVKVKPDDGYKMVCKDGPVFDAEEIVW
jgi:dihydroorotate dehydrogenase electron transfer subunit